jgi:hypothetical protein
MKSIYYNLTLKDFIELNSVEGNDLEAKRSKLSILYKVDKEFFDNMTSKEVIEFYSMFEKLEAESIKAVYKSKVKVGSKWFYIDYRLSQISAAQFIDISHFAKSNPLDNIHKIIASCVRPMSWRFGKPGKYNGTEHEEISELLLNNMKIKDAYPIMVFFCNLSNRLSDNILSYFLSKSEEMENQLRTLTQNGDGLRQ